MSVIAKAVIGYADRRGDISDVLEFKQPSIDCITRIRSVAGAVRGNHYHKNTHQYTYIIRGKTRVVYQTEKGEKKEYIVGPGEVVYHAPNEPHAFEALSDTEWLVFTEGPRAGDNYESDTFRLEEPLI